MIEEAFGNELKFYQTILKKIDEADPSLRLEPKNLL
jgi:hypothetical protein